MRSRIMVIGRDVGSRARLARLLSREGYRAEVVESLAHARRAGLDGVALAIAANELDGSEAEALAELRAVVGRVLVVASGGKRAASPDVVDVADEPGLLARIAEALTPEGEREAAGPALEFAGYRLDLAGHTLADPAGKDIPLTHGEFSLLRAFAERAGRVLSRDQLMQLIAGRDAESYDRSVDMHIARLRRKIEPDPKRPGLIVTVPGSGYKFAAQTRQASLTTPTPSPGPEPPPAPPEAAPRAPERRHVTALAAELAPPPGGRLPTDPEDLGAIVGAFRRAASAVVTQHGGVIGQSRGREILAYFGYPTAQENDAERSMRAALAIQRALSEQNNSKGAPALSARIGLECGLAVVDSTGEVFGDAPDVAARVLTAAEPGSVLVTINVLRQAPGLFVAEERGASELFGASEPINLFRIIRASGGRRLGARALTPLVGREEELNLLRRRWERAAKGEGQFVQIVGEPGIGKSRLVEEFRLKLGKTPHTWAEFSSSQLLQNTPLHPIAEWGRQRFGDADIPAGQRLADLENTLQLIGLDPSEHVPLIAPLVDIPLPPVRTANLPPEELRRRQLAALVAWFLAGARSQPVAIAFEDLHWADPTSLDLMQTLAERGAQAPLLILATARPEFRSPWSLRSHHGVISLSPLDRADIALMVGEIAARHVLSREVVEGLSERTGGVPLFVEEVTRLLLERGEAGGLQAIPPTLQQSLAARLDRLGDAREVAQIGAVLGRDFSYALLAAVAAVDDRGAALGERGYSDRALQSALDRLAGADLLIVEGAGRDANYRFKHALIQDAAYDSLLKSRRQALHRRAAEVLCDQPERAAAEPEVVAHHFTEAGLDDLAIEWWGKAGDQALRRSAFQEAIAHLGKAIAMADKGDGGTAAGDSGELAQLQVSYGNALIAERGYGAPETTKAFARARESAFGGKDTNERLAADYGLWVGSIVRGELLAARAYADALVSDVEARPDSPEAGVAHRAAGVTHWFAGEYHEAREHLERALALFQPGRDDDLAFRFGNDAGAGAMLYLALTLWPLGDIGRAATLVGAAEARGAGLAHTATHAYANMHAALFAVMRGDFSRAAPRAVEVVRVAREHDLQLWLAFGLVLEGSASAQNGAPSDGPDNVWRGVELLREQNVLLFDGLFKIALAEAEACAGDVDRALAVLDEALATSERIGHRTFDAELHRVRGEMLLIRDPANPASAEEAFRAAIAVAKRQGTRSFELRAALALAKLYQSTGRPAGTHAVLAPALEGFSATPEMPEIGEAQTLLAAPAETGAVKAALAQRERRLRLQTAYGQAAMYSKGFAAEETKAAFARAAALAATSGDFSQRFAAAHGQWTVALVRGELKSALDMASPFLLEAENEGRLVEAAVARRGLALISYLVGDFAGALAHCERALAACEPDRDQEARERFSEDTGCIALSIHATTSWQLGEVERARELIVMADRRAAALGHAPSMAHPLQSKFSLELQRGDAAAALAAAEALAALGRDHGMAHWLADAELYAFWARCRLRDPAAGAALSSLRGARSRGWFSMALLAELELQTHGVDAALARIDEALALARQVEHRCNLPFAHLVRGDILLERDPAPAEEAFQTARAMAKEQGARTWGLRAAHSLAKLYQSTACPAKAHAVLEPALEGFSATPEMPEIAEAQALLAALAETDEVKSDAASRQRRLQLQTRYSQAMMYSRGFGSDESKTAFARARMLAVGAGDASERFDAYYGLFIGSLSRGELNLAQETAESFLRDAENKGRMTEAAVARRCMGMARLWEGDFINAHANLAEVLRTYDPERDRDAKFRFGVDSWAAAAAQLTVAIWALGDVERARALSEEALARADKTAHAPTRATAYHFISLYQVLRGDSKTVMRTAKIPVDLGREHGMALYLMCGEMESNWALARLGDRESGMCGLRDALAALLVQGDKLQRPLFQGLLAELEAEAQDADGPLRRIGEALALANETGEHWTDVLLHRIRGAILLKRDPANPAPAEEAFLAAIAVAQAQKARSFELQAALSLAKLYQSAVRPVDAHAVLAPALEGFSPTPEMPEIGEA
jgi:DNA-binding response OmpR family regulator/class 3 adenylate cyclase/predicted ATPase